MAVARLGPKPHGGAYETFPDGPEDYRAPGADGTLQRLFQAAVAHAQNRIDWYDRKAGEKGRVARRLRWVALTLFAVGTLAPILLTLLVKLAAAYADGRVPHPLATIARAPLAEIGFVALGVAGALVIFDQFFDSSGSWIRFRQAQSRLEVLLADLRFGWAELLAKSDGVPADKNTATACIALLREFVIKVERLAETETKEWAERFRTRIDSFDSSPNLSVRMDARDRRESRAPDSPAAATEAETARTKPVGGGNGADATRAKLVHVRLSIEGAAGLDPASLRLTVNGAQAVVPDDHVLDLPLEIGTVHRLIATADRAGQPVQGELALTPTVEDAGRSFALKLHA